MGKPTLTFHIEEKSKDCFTRMLKSSLIPTVNRETIKKYAAAINGLMMDILRKMSEGLGLPNVSFEDWPCQFRINKYHFTPEAVGSSGVQIHTDSGFLTILQDDESVGGLEVMKKSGEFVAVDPWPNTLLVNLGDMGTVTMLLLYLVHFQDLTCSNNLILASGGVCLAGS